MAATTTIKLFYLGHFKPGIGTSSARLAQREVLGLFDGGALFRDEKKGQNTAPRTCL